MLIGGVVKVLDPSRCPLPVQFARHDEGHGFQDNPRSRNHVARKNVRQAGLDFGDLGAGLRYSLRRTMNWLAITRRGRNSRGLLLWCSRLFRQTRQGDDANQLLLARPSLGLHHGRHAYAGVSGQVAFDLAELNPLAADLDLTVPATEVLDRSVGPVPCEVTCAVDACGGNGTCKELPLRPGRVLDKGLCRLLRIVQIAAGYQGTADDQLADGSNWRKPVIALPRVNNPDM
jgi:hypothetical protein